jgi:hypothetical protein
MDTISFTILLICKFEMTRVSITSRYTVISAGSQEMSFHSRYEPHEIESQNRILRPHALFHWSMTGRFRRRASAHRVWSWERRTGDDVTQMCALVPWADNTTACQQVTGVGKVTRRDLRSMLSACYGLRENSYEVGRKSHSRCALVKTRYSIGRPIVSKNLN